MFGNMFRKKEEVQDVTIYAPTNGELVPLEEVPDPVFSQKMMGDGIAIKPSNEIVVAPVQGKVIQLFHTKHAIGIQAANGAEILIHIGLDTVNLDGEGFRAHVQEGDTVNQGDKLITFDREVIKEKAKSTIIPVIITNTDEMREISSNDKSKVTSEVDEILVVKK